jgi:hypothetical protein
MSVQEFWTSVTTAKGLLARPMVEVDSPKSDSTSIARTIERAELWLTPESVDGFDPAEFDFLPPDECAELAEAVARFREVAEQVPFDGPATREQSDIGRRELLRMLKVVDTERYSDADAFVIGKRLRSAIGQRLPSFIRDLRVETGFDAGDNPAVWIRVVIDDEAANDDVRMVNSDLVRRTIGKELKRMGDSRWPYVWLHTVSEEVELARERR